MGANKVCKVCIVGAGVSGIVEEEGLPYFDKFKEELARVLQENMSRLF